MDYKDFLPTVPEKKLIRRKESVINKEQARKDEPGVVVQVLASDPDKPKNKRLLYTVPAWYWDNSEPIEVWR